MKESTILQKKNAYLVTYLQNENPVLPTAAYTMKINKPKIIYITNNKGDNVHEPTVIWKQKHKHRIYTNKHS